MLLKEVCCGHLQFMWDNHLLERRTSYVFGPGEGRTRVVVGITKGFRVRRSFFLLQRDRILYRCPFCNRELIFLDEVRVPDLDFHFQMNLVKIGGTLEKPDLEVPVSALKQALIETKRRSKKWPPEK